MTKKQKERIEYIQSHPDYNNTRCINTMIAALLDGIPIEDVNTLFRLVEQAYTEEGKHRRPGYIRYKFKKAYAFLIRELY